MTAAVLGVTATLTLVFCAIAHPQTARREIVSDDFTRPRPTPTPKPPRTGGLGKIGGMIGGVSTRPLPRPPKRYRLAASTAPDAKPLTATDDIAQLGVTLWRLRPARNSSGTPALIDSGPRLLIKDYNKSSEWIPERIEMDSPLREGDRVRLTIESPREGYLYVVDRDLYADGNMGDAVLIFPTRSIRGGDNQLRPGKLIDLPGQEETPNVLTARRRSGKGNDQIGKVLTIIFSTIPLDLADQDPPLLISAANMTKMEKAWGSETERFEMIDGAGQAWTEEEKEASTTTLPRQLTQNEAPPQTIYRIASTNKTAFLINVRLSYAGAVARP